MSIYDTLNDRQQEAVFHTEGPLLILATCPYTQDCLADRSDRCEPMEYPGDHIYEQGSRGDA